MTECMTELWLNEWLNYDWMNGWTKTEWMAELWLNEWLNYDYMNGWTMTEWMTEWTKKNSGDRFMGLVLDGNSGIIARV